MSDTSFGSTGKTFSRFQASGPHSSEPAPLRSIKTSCHDAKDTLETLSCDANPFRLAEYSISFYLVISVLGIFSSEDDQNQVRHRTEYCFEVSLLPSMAHCCWTFDFVWILLLFVLGRCKGPCLQRECQNLMHLRVAMSESRLTDESLAVLFFWRRS